MSDFNGLRATPNVSAYCASNEYEPEQSPSQGQADVTTDGRPAVDMPKFWMSVEISDQEIAFQEGQRQRGEQPESEEGK